jgi:TRAP-type C4-dicarboxylate transport system substrate-binding protein
MMNPRIRSVIGVSALIGIGCASTVSAQAQTVTLKFATFGSEKSAVNACGPAGVINDITKRTNGRIKFIRFFAGTAFSHPLKQYSQIARGVTDMTQGVLTYTPGRFPLTSMATLPFLMKDHVAGSRALTRLTKTKLKSEFDDIHMMAIIMTGLYQFHLRKPIKSVSDFKGLRIRGSGRIHRSILEKLGAIPAQLPAPALYEALSKGVIDGAMMPWAAVLSWKLGEVTKYNLQAGISGALVFFGMSKKAYAGLPADLKTIIDKDFSGPKLAARISKCWDPVDAKAKALAKKMGNQIVVADDAMIGAFKKRLSGVADDYVAKLEKKGLPARETLAAMKKAIAEEEAKAAK